YELAAEVEPNFPNLYFNLGLVLAMSDQRPDAINALTKYQDLAPKEEATKAEELLDSLRRSLSTKP
ncbi:MAG: hypothetical protein HY708_03870, partial [Ignavibacteriae bacterium]|nr:hypothetical protein [Ignavibacteriota bacterium]